QKNGGKRQRNQDCYKHMYCPSLSLCDATTRYDEKQDCQDAARLCGYRVGHHEEPDDHRDSNAMSDQVSFSMLGGSVSIGIEETPREHDSKDQAEPPKEILVLGNADVRCNPCPAVVTTPDLRVILDQQHRVWDQQKTRTHQNSLKSRAPIQVG